MGTLSHNCTVSTRSCPHCDGGIDVRYCLPQSLYSKRWFLAFGLRLRAFRLAIAFFAMRLVPDYSDFGIEYISTLEGDIAERDRLIDAIRNELGSTKSENIALRQEIAALKKALLEGRGRADTPVLPPPAPLPSIPASLLASGPSSNGVSNLPVPPKSPLLTPNTQKDLPTSPRLGARGFWGGASGSGLGGFGGITPVHTTLVPEWGSILSGKPLAGVKSAPGRRSPALQENINPILNLSTAQDKLREQQQQQQQHVPSGALESFMDMNPFSMKTIDPYVMSTA